MVTQQQKDKTVLNLANGLSLLRIILAPIFMWAIFSGKNVTGFILLLIAIFTDFLDGQVARIGQMQTRFGKMLDPLADKIIIFLAFLALMVKFNFPILVGLLIISRDIILMAGSLIFLYKNKKSILVPNLLGKITTFLQMSTIVAYIVSTPPLLRTTLIILTVIATMLSAFVYFSKGYTLFFRKPAIKINLPNKITILRMLLIPFFIGFMLSELPYKETIAAVIFIALALTDALDGYIARKNRQITSFGKLIDPLADKLLVSAALIFLIGKGISAWMAFTIIAREFAVTGLRTIALTRDITIPAKTSGKIKTVIQVVAIAAVLLHLSFSYYLMLAAVAITLYSGIEYFWLGRHLFKELS